MKRLALRIGIGTLATAALAAFGLWVYIVRPDAGVPTFEQVRAAWHPSEAYLLDRTGEVLDRARVDFGVRRYDWVALADISPALRAAVIDGEDRRFREHAGVDWLGIASAAADDLFGGRSRGASTITMQLAGLIDERVPERNAGPAWRRKLIQLHVAHAIEAGWSKDEILEAYLNRLGFRGELEGIGAATAVLAGKSPSGLDLTESVVLAALLPAPNAGERRIAERACKRALADGVSDCALIRAKTHEMLTRPSRRDETPALASAVARSLLRVPGKRVQTTLDARWQRAAQLALSNQLGKLAGRNVRDGAVLVVDNASGEVLAYVGSAGPHSTAAEVDGVRALRQAGSTLKPFLYELALEKRYLTPASLLEDSPLHLETATGVYLPQDYDKDYKGLVSVRTALASSLNVPAVRTLVLVGVEPFRDRLQEVGYRSVREDGEFYGFSLALGSAEVSLWEQVEAYRTLARGGRYSPIRVTPQSLSTDVNVLDAAPAFLVADMLSDRAARTVTFGLDNHLATPFWSAVKTGTSKDMRDNWCIGFSSRYTVGVWVGNFEGDSMHDVSGVSGAAPVWQELMSKLHAGSPPGAPTAPTGVVRTAVRFTPAVEAPREEWFLASTESRLMTAAAADERRTRIASPANGLVIALDPDIPPAQQRLPLTVEGADRSMVLKLNGQPIGAANRSRLWAPVAGSWRLAVEDARGAVLDQILFTVR